MTDYIDEAEDAFWADGLSDEYWEECDREMDLIKRRHKARMETEYKATGYWLDEEGYGSHPNAT